MEWKKEIYDWCVRQQENQKGSLPKYPTWYEIPQETSCVLTTLPKPMKFLTLTEADRVMTRSLQAGDYTVYKDINGNDIYYICYEQNKRPRYTIEVKDDLIEGLHLLHETTPYAKWSYYYFNCGTSCFFTFNLDHDVIKSAPHIFASIYTYLYNTQQHISDLLFISDLVSICLSYIDIRNHFTHLRSQDGEWMNIDKEYDSSI